MTEDADNELKTDTVDEVPEGGVIPLRGYNVVPGPGLFLFILLPMWLLSMVFGWIEGKSRK